jgi:hypothetical protein
MGRPFRGSGPTGRGNTLKPCSVWVRIPGAAPARVSQFGRGSGSRSRQVRVRIPPRAPGARSPIGRRHDAQTVGSVGSNPSARTTFTGSVPAEWSATSPENWDGYLTGRGFDSSALRQTRTAQTVRLPCLPAKQCVPAVGYSDHARDCPPRRPGSAVVAQGQSSAPVSRRSRFEPARRLQLRGSVTCGTQDAGCNPVAFGRAVRLGLSPPTHGGCDDPSR